MAMNIPASPKISTTSYADLKGIDLTRDQTEVSIYRSPDCLNMISDDGGNPTKRLGWRVVNEELLVAGISAGKVLDFTKHDGYIFVVRERAVSYIESGEEIPIRYDSESLWYDSLDFGSVVKVGSFSPYSIHTWNFTSPSTMTAHVVNFKNARFISFDGKLYVMATGLYRPNGSKEFETPIVIQVSKDSLRAMKRPDLPTYINVSGGVATEKDSFRLENERDNLYVPLVSVGISPDGTGGTSLYDINLLTKWRTYSYLGNDTDKVYRIYPSTVSEQKEYNRISYGFGRPLVEVLNTEGWVSMEEGTDYTIDTVYTDYYAFDEFGNKLSYNIKIAKPYITFKEAHKPLVTGQDNVRITFIPYSKDTITVDGVTGRKGIYTEGLKNLFGFSSSTVYGHNSMDRIFIVGNKEQNKIYYSDSYEPTYFPDINYITVGHSGNGVKGIHHKNGYLVAIKGDGFREPTSFLINGAIYDEGGTDERTIFKVTPMATGIGAVSGETFSTLADEPLFLSSTGVCAISSTYTEYEKSISNRSGYVDRKLTKEPNLEKACACTWRGYYILAVNGHAYVLDSRNVSTDPRNQQNTLYEAYYWDDFPAEILRTYGDELYFVKDGVTLCKFNTDVEDGTAYSDNGTMVDGKIVGGDAIKCRWSTPLDADYRPQYYKTLQKKGALVTIGAYEKTSAKVTLVKNGVDRYELDTFYSDISSWSASTVDGISFATNEVAQDKFFKKKLKKYKRLQIVIENEGLYEPFSLLNIVKSYAVNDLAKR